jgi:hypothetical protein
VLIFRSVADKQEHTGGRQALDEAVQKRLRFTVNPMEVLGHQDQGSDLALAQQQLFDGLQEALAALRRVERLPECILSWNLQEHKERRQDRLYRCLQLQKLIGDLRHDRLSIIASVKLKVVLEQINDGPIGHRLAIRVRPGREDPPAIGLICPDELVAQTGLPDPWLPNNARYLPPPLPHLCQQVFQNGELPLAPHKSTQEAPPVELQR